MNIALFKRQPIMGILRGVERDAIDPLIETIIPAGLKTVEITMNTADAAALIRRVVKLAKGRLAVGAGTVIDKKLLQSALGAGATFIVMPVFIHDIVKQCVSSKIPVFPGAFTPKEIYEAWGAGATMVKVFPSGFLGPEYFKEVKGPFDDIELMACGGVTPDNLKSYFSCGASAVAFGASVFRREWLREKNFGQIKKLIEKYISEYANI